MNKTELFKCDYCHILVEGIEGNDCPLCHHHFLTLVAKYPSFKEEYEEEKSESAYAEG